MKKIYFIIAISISVRALAQSDSSKVKINVEGFLDMYYAFDLTNPDATDRQPFLYNHNRNNSFSINLALVKFTAENDKFHSNISLQMGDYVNYNLAHEPSAVKNIYEAYGGFKMAKKLWIDVGVFSSNLGFESAISTENITLTRSLVAENSPYYLSGIRAVYEISDKFTFTGIVSNGWQIIKDNNKSKAIGTQLEFSPNDNILINWSTFFGGETSGNQVKAFNDLYTTIKLSETVNIIACFDYGIDGESD